MEWVNKNINWYEGARLLTHSTNNALESTNRTFNAENTLRERLRLYADSKYLYNGNYKKIFVKIFHHRKLFQS